MIVLHAGSERQITVRIRIKIKINVKVNIKINVKATDRSVRPTRSLLVDAAGQKSSVYRQKVAGDKAGSVRRQKYSRST
jgi:hypothetical protein